MNIKSLLLGSAAALVAVSGARAADAIVAAEPEPVEYVRVCDAFGTGYFYIPGTETCLRISGYVRVQNDFMDNNIKNAATFNATAAVVAGTVNPAIASGSAIDQTTRARVNFSAKSDTEYGMLEGYIGMQGNDGAMGVDEVFLSIGGLKMGWFYHWNDRGLAGETDSITGATTRFNSIMYSMSGGAFTYGVSLDQRGVGGWATNSAAAPAALTTETEGLGVSGILGGTFGAVTADIVGFYDTEVNEGGVRVLASAALGAGTLGLQGAYNSGANMYIDANGFGVVTAAPVNVAAFPRRATPFYTEWMIGADYTFQATDKLKLGVGGQYASVNAVALVAANKPNVADLWKIGATADYNITTGLDLKATVNYEVFDGNATIGNLERDSVTGFIRLQRSF
jgi:hypothetical protein